MAKEFEDAKHREKILDRIQKLLAVANGTEYEEEAKTAMRMAQSYMSQYGLSLTDVELAKELEGEIVEEFLTEHAARKTPEHWECLLAMAVAVVFDCQAIRHCYLSGYAKMKFVGYTKDVQMAKIVFRSLYISCRATACKRLPRGAGKIRLSFMYGVAERIWERAKEEKVEARKEPTGRYSLVVVEKSSRIQKWCHENMNLKESKKRSPSIDPFAYLQGRIHGDTLDLMNKEKVEQGEQLRLGRS